VTTLKPLTSSNLQPSNPVTLEPLKEGWRWVRLGEVCEITMGQSPPGASYNSDGLGVPLLNGPTEFGPINPTPVQWTISPTRFAEPGDILLCVRGATTGRKNIADRRYCVGRGLAAIQGRNEQATTSFLWFVLDIFTGSLIGQTSGSTFPNLPGEKLKRVEIPLPPLPEQNRIAAKIQELMQEVERARTACEKQLEAAKALPAAYLREVFESEETKKWERKRLREGCLFEYGTGLPDRDRTGGSVPVFASNGIVGYHNIAITQAPIIIIGRKGSIGQINYSEVPCWPIDTTYYIDPSKTQCDLPWLYWLLKWLRLDLLNKATGVPGLNREDAYSQIIPFPSVAVQKRIASELKEKMAEVEKLRISIEKQLEAINALPQTVLRKAFRGEL